MLKLWCKNVSLLSKSVDLMKLSCEFSWLSFWTTVYNGKRNQSGKMVD